jgi:hypothetical protein
MLLLMNAADAGATMFMAMLPVLGLVFIIMVLGAILAPTRKKGRLSNPRKNRGGTKQTAIDQVFENLLNRLIHSGGRPREPVTMHPTTPPIPPYSALMDRPAPDREITCPACGSDCRVSSTTISKDVTCVRCHSVFPMPAAVIPPMADKHLVPFVVSGVGKERSASWSVEALQQLEWKRFETVCVEFLKALGFQAKETKTGADGGVDIVLHRAGMARPMAIAQCKAWRNRPVGVKPVRELLGVMAAGKIEHGIFLTTSSYTAEAWSFAKSQNLELVDGAKLISFIRQLDADAQDMLLQSAFTGDYSTPTCPQCDVKMTLRTNRKGNQSGSQFWGCPNFPRCRQRFYISS